MDNESISYIIGQAIKHGFYQGKATAGVHVHVGIIIRHPDNPHVFNLFPKVEKSLLDWVEPTINFLLSDSQVSLKERSILNEMIDNIIVRIDRLDKKLKK